MFRNIQGFHLHIIKKLLSTSGFYNDEFWTLENASSDHTYIRKPQVCFIQTFVLYKWEPILLIKTR